MEGLEDIAKNLKKEMDKLNTMFSDTLARVREQDPEKIDGIMREHKDVMKAIKNKDVEALTKYQKKYAGKSNR